MPYRGKRGEAGALCFRYLQGSPASPVPPVAAFPVTTGCVMVGPDRLAHPGAPSDRDAAGASKFRPFYASLEGYILRMYFRKSRPMDPGGKRGGNTQR